MLGADAEMAHFTVVTLDLWDTLIHERPDATESASSARVRMLGGVLASRGLLEHPDQLRPAYDRSGRYLETVWSKGLDLPVEDQVLYMFRALGDSWPDVLAEKDLSDIVRMYSEVILSRPPVMLDGARELLGSLRGSGHRLALISNTGRTPGRVLRTVLERMGLLEHFELTAFSDELLARKPSPKVFGSVLARLGVPPDSVVHLGDNVEADIVGAKSFGMSAVQVALAGQPRHELADGYVNRLDQLPECVRRLEAKL